MALANWGDIWGDIWGPIWAEDGVLVEVPDVVGDSEAAGTTELETALFVVSVATAYSDSVALGLIISQSPTAGSFATEGSTVTITVSLGPSPTLPLGGGDDAWFYDGPPRKQKDYRQEQDERRQREERELREQVERAALIARAKDLLTEAKETAAVEPPSTQPRTKRLRVFRRQVDKLEQELRAIREAENNEQALKAAQERIDQLVAKAADELVTQVAEALTDLINEIIEETDE